MGKYDPGSPQGGTSGVTPNITGNIGMFPVVGPYSSGSDDLIFCIPFDPATSGTDLGTTTVNLTVPLFTCPSGIIAALLASPFQMSEPSTADQWDLNCQAIISNEAGSEFIVVAGSANIPLGQTVGGILTTDYSVSSSAGSDLSYDSATGDISSAAGGTYGMLFRVVGTWD